MADFCLECTFNIFPELLRTGENDLAGLCEPGEKVWAVCEGCGPGWFDFTGQRVTTPKAPTVAVGNIYSGERSAADRAHQSHRAGAQEGQLAVQLPGSANVRPERHVLTRTGRPARKSPGSASRPAGPWPRPARSTRPRAGR